METIGIRLDVAICLTMISKAHLNPKRLMEGLQNDPEKSLRIQVPDGQQKETQGEWMGWVGVTWFKGNECLPAPGAINI